MPVSRDELAAIRDLTKHWQQKYEKSEEEGRAMRRVLVRLVRATRANDPIQMTDIAFDAQALLE